MQVDERETAHQRKQHAHPQRAGSQHRTVAQMLQQHAQPLAGIRIGHEVSGCRQYPCHQHCPQDIGHGQHQKGVSPGHPLAQVTQQEAPQKPAQYRTRHIKRHGPRHAASAPLFPEIGDQHHADAGHGQPLQKTQHHHLPDTAGAANGCCCQPQKKHRPHNQPLAPDGIGQQAHERRNQRHSQHRGAHDVPALHHRSPEIVQQQGQDGLHRINLQKSKYPDQRHRQKQQGARGTVFGRQGETTLKRIAAWHNRTC